MINGWNNIDHLKFNVYNFTLTVRIIYIAPLNFYRYIYIDEYICWNEIKVKRKKFLFWCFFLNIRLVWFNSSQPIKLGDSICISCFCLAYTLNKISCFICLHFNGSGKFSLPHKDIHTPKNIMLSFVQTTTKNLKVIVSLIFSHGKSQTLPLLKASHVKIHRIENKVAGRKLAKV